MLAASATASLAALSGCAGVAIRTSNSPLTVRVSNTTDREYRIELELLKPNATQLADAKAVDELSDIQPAEEFVTTTENQRYHVRARLVGKGYVSQQYQYQYYPSCGDDDEPNPTLSLVIHPKSEAGRPFIGYSQAEC
jgi:hypothetical protein